MEQKKILWVVFSISFFVVLIFGVAIYLYAPFRNKSMMNSVEVADLGVMKNSSTKIDPLKWTRDPESVPQLEESKDSSVNIQNNITVVNGEVDAETKTNKVEKDDSVNVSNLIENKENEKETTTLPDSLSKPIADNDSQKSTEKKVETKKNAKTGVSAKKGSLASTKKSSNSIVKKKSNIKKLPSKSATKSSRTQKSLSKNTIDTAYWVQTASLTSRLNAENARKKLSDRHMAAQIFTKKTGTGTMHRVRVGPFRNKTEAEYWLKKIKNMKGFELSYVSQTKKKN